MTNLSNKCAALLANAIKNVALTDVEKIANKVALEYGESAREKLIASLISLIHTQA